jgi:hypothetical protein
MIFNPLTRIVRLSFLLAATGLAFSSCQKEIQHQIDKQTAAPSTQVGVFTEYVIRAGQQFSEQSGVKAVKVSSMKFTVKFDNSAKYTTKDPANQADINKLYGFSDNNGQHHEFSARFGWRWYNNKLNLQAYIYNNSVRDYKEIGDIELNKEYACAINVYADRYDFLLNGVVKVSMPRKAAGSEASGYQLYPYFGGDELAPHEIKIWIRDDK